MDKQTFIQKWEAEIINSDEILEQKYADIKKNSGSNNPVDHLWALLNFDLVLRIDKTKDSCSRYWVTLYGIDESKKKLDEEMNFLNGFHLVRSGRFLEDELKTFESDRNSNVEPRLQILTAISLYEDAVYKYAFVGSHPYERLAILYKKYDGVDKQIEILEKAVTIFEGTRKERDFQIKLDKALESKIKLKK